MRWASSDQQSGPNGGDIPNLQDPVGAAVARQDVTGITRRNIRLIPGESLSGHGHVAGDAMYDKAANAVMARPPACDLTAPPGGRDRLRDLVGPAGYARLTSDPDLALQLTSAQARAHVGDCRGAIAGLDSASEAYLAAGSLGAAAVALAAAGVIAQEDGRLAVARERFATAIEAAERAGDQVAFAVSALGLGGVWVHEHRSALERARVRELQRRALTGLGPTEPLALRLRARLTAEDAYLTNRPENVLRILGEARTRSNPSVLGTSCRGPITACSARSTARLGALAGELMAVSAVTGRPLDALMGLAWHTMDLFLRGDPHAERSFRELRRRTEAQRVECLRFVVAAMETMLAIRAGRLADAERSAEECHRLGAEVGDADALGWYFAHLVTIRWMQGRGEEMLPAVAELIHSTELAEPNESFVAAVAALAASAGRSDEARAALQRLRGVHGLTALRSSSTWLVTLLGVVEAAHLLGDVAAAEEAYGLLAPHADLPVMASLAVTCFGSAHRPLGLAALTLGDAEGAVRHLQAAVDADLRLGNLPCHALSCAALAQALLARGAPGDADRAAALLDEAIAHGRRLGLSGRVAAWQRQRADAAAHRIGAPVDVRRDGRGWRVSVGSRAVEVPHSVGMTYLAELVRNPGVELSAVQLASAHQLTVDPHHHLVLDDRARAEYRRRVEELRAEIEDAQDAGNAERAARARLELDWLIDELSRTTGLAGRGRAFDDRGAGPHLGAEGDQARGGPHQRGRPGRRRAAAPTGRDRRTLRVPRPGRNRRTLTPPRNTARHAMARRGTPSQKAERGGRGAPHSEHGREARRWLSRSTIWARR